MRRRRCLALLGTAITGGLAGCIGGDDGGNEGTTDVSTERSPSATDSDPTGTATGTRTRTRTETATRTNAGTDAPTATDSTTEESTSETTSGTTEGGTDGSSEGARTVEVGPGGRYLFAPGTDESLEVSAGTTVEWVWRSDLHNIVVDSQPADADWEGTPGGAGETYNTGYTYTHTFEVPGEYHYWCEPHRSLGMDADVLVTDS